MSKTKLPSECGDRHAAARRPPPAPSAGARPRPGRPRRRTSAAADHGAGPARAAWVYCVAPVREHHDDVDPPVSRRTAPSTRSRSACTQRPGPRRHPHRQRARRAGRGHRRLADRVEAEEPEPHPVALDDRGPGRRGQVAPGTERRDPAAARARARCPAAPGRRSRRRGCSPATARRSRAARAVRAGRGPPPNESPPWVGAPRVDSVLSRLPTVMSARRSIGDIGASAAAGSGTPRLSIRSPTTSEVARAGVVADRVHPADSRGHHRRPHGFERYDGQGARVTFDGVQRPSSAAAHGPPAVRASGPPDQW